MSRSITPNSIASDADREAVLAEIKRFQEKNQFLADKIAERDQTLKTLKQKASKVQQDAECEEEKIGNTLLRRVSSLKRENAKLEARRRQSEASKAHVLESIAAVRRQKVQIENRIEAEQELLMNQLHKEMCRISSEKAMLEHKLHHERADFIKTLQHEANKLRRKQEQQASNTEPKDQEETEMSPLHPLHKRGCSFGASGEGQSTPDRALTPVASRTGVPSTESKILELENVLCSMLDEAAAEKRRADQLAQENERLLVELQAMQRDSFLERAKATKMKEELERAQQELNFEKQMELKIQRGHRRTASTSSVDTMESFQTVSTSARSSYSAASSQHASPAINLNLASRDRHQVREHTARVLRNASMPSPSPIARHGLPSPSPLNVSGAQSQEGERSASGSRRVFRSAASVGSTASETSGVALRGTSPGKVRDA